MAIAASSAVVVIFTPANSHLPPPDFRLLACIWTLTLRFKGICFFAFIDDCKSQNVAILRLETLLLTQISVTGKEHLKTIGL
jgi:hypothetical protein